MCWFLNRRVAAVSKDSNGADDNAWDALTKDVKPLKSDKKLHHEIPKLKRVLVNSKPAISFNERKFVRSDTPIDVGTTHQMDHRKAKKFKQGEIKIEGRIDLHGMTLEQAYAALERFIIRSAEAGKRSLLVITGHGLRSETGRGIIREQTPIWLNEPHLRRYILAITQAEPKDGGAGALYVMLRRNR